jgi:hypothetical protein
MNLQFISDNNGKVTGVFIPISEWESLKNKYKGIEDEQIDIPQWQIDEVRIRLADYKENPHQLLDAKNALKDIEKGL